jgi:protein SCO1/2
VAACLLAGEAQARGADGKFEKRTSSHFVLFQDVAIDESSGLRGSRRFEQLVLAELESAYDRLHALLGLEPPRPIEVVIYDPAIFDRQFAGLFRFSAAGFYAGVIRVRGDTVLGVPLSRVLHHELVHAALDAAMPSTALPAWLNEGLAEWFEARASGKHLRARVRRPRPLPPPGRPLLARAALHGELRAPGAGRRVARLSPVLRHARLSLACFRRARAARAGRGDRAHAQPGARHSARVPRGSRRARGGLPGNFGCLQRMRSNQLSSLLAAALLSAASACSDGPAADRYPASGIVREVLLEDHQVVIEHGEIEGLMPGMTMSFDVPDHELLETLAAGQAIDFTVEVTGKSYRVVEATVKGAAGSAGSSGSFSELAVALDPAPDFELIDQNGAKLALADLRGKLVLLDFIFTSCQGPCPMLTSAHVTLQRMLSPELRARTRFVSISLDPVRDTPMALRAYALARGADLAGWSFLTGDPEAIAVVLKGYGVGSMRRPDGQLDHLVATFLIDPEGRIARRFIGLEHEPEELLSALEAQSG